LQHVDKAVRKQAIEHNIEVIKQGVALGSDSLTRLYGVSSSDSNTEILLRHRAVLFAIIGLFLLLSVFKSEYQPIAICIGLISVASFLLINPEMA
jgi:hypothetical protein